jgi:hypothetical protein
MIHPPAARAGALCFVVRSSKWRPPDWRPPDWLEGRPFRVGEGNWIKEVPTFWLYFDTCLERPEPLRPTREPDETGTTGEQGQTSGVANNPSGAESCSASPAGAASFPSRAAHDLPQVQRAPTPASTARWRRLLSGASSRKIHGHVDFEPSI